MDEQNNQSKNKIFDNIIIIIMTYSVRTDMIYRPNSGVGRYLAFNTKRLSASTPRRVDSMIGSAVGGGGSSRRTLNWYVRNGTNSKQFSQRYYPSGLIVL